MLLPAPHIHSTQYSRVVPCTVDDGRAIKIQEQPLGHACELLGADTAQQGAEGHNQKDTYLLGMRTG